MPDVTMLIKPAGGLCDLACQYCFYKDEVDRRRQDSRGFLDEDTARQIIRRAYQAARPQGHIRFLFQGGEPTLAGLDFFRSFLRMEEAYVCPGVTVSHAIQTNGQRLDAAWAAFFLEADFLVGLSVDGTQNLHDRFRQTPQGQGTWYKTAAALRLLDALRVETNLLCVVTGPAARKPHPIYRSLTALGGHALQFIPCLQPLDACRGEVGYALSPERYGHFLCGVFDCWFADWRAGRYVSVRLFDDYVRILLRRPPISCAASGRCGAYLVVEHDGRVYPCDFYALDEWCLGNIRDTDIARAQSCAKAQDFQTAGARRPPECAACRYGPLCRGGCRREWTAAGSNAYCGAYKAFFDYAIERLETVAASLDDRRP